MTILDEIIAFKKEEITEARKKFPESRLQNSKLFRRKVLPMTESLLSPDKTGIIAEFKRMSPSKGMINADCSIEEVITGYFRCGASGLSVLTDNHFFGGNNDDLKRARELTSIPVLRKDFIIDQYQITEARAIGADLILIIAAAVSRSQADELAAYARSLDLQVLLEVHNADELNYVSNNVNIVGVNNRDLKTFKIDIETSVNLACEIPDGFLKISESGITSPLVYKKLKGCGYNGFLIGENFMRTPEPAKAFADFVELITS
ncbi:MAG TPA: indole-3-glycerol phosphate synthase TrpC [Bacteroidales bacterium]|nr:indole-3-glycerol phosphate synthase TrpC [Bacteroidales bacterium]